MSKPKTVTIAPDVLGVLERARVEGTRLDLVGQLDRDLYTRVAKIIELLGGKWNRKAGAHIFEEDAEGVVADALVTGAVVDLRKTFQMFETPPDLAKRLVEIAGVQAGDRVLEPSAGTGRIASVLHEAGASVLMCEIQERLHDDLGRFGTVIGTDFMTTEVQTVDAVVANPPFSRGQDVTHVHQMTRWLGACGRLVSVMSPAWRFRDTKAHRQFREMVDELGATWEDLPDGTFSASGTNVRTGILIATGARA